MTPNKTWEEASLTLWSVLISETAPINTTVNVGTVNHLSLPTLSE